MSAASISQTGIEISIKKASDSSTKIEIRQQSVSHQPSRNAAGAETHAKTSTSNSENDTDVSPPKVENRRNDDEATTAREEVRSLYPTVEDGHQWNSLQSEWNIPSQFPSVPCVGVERTQPYASIATMSYPDESIPPPPAQVRSTSQMGRMLMSQPLIDSPYPNKVSPRGGSKEGAVGPRSRALTPPTAGKIYSPTIFSTSHDTCGGRNVMDTIGHADEQPQKICLESGHQTARQQTTPHMDPKAPVSRTSPLLTKFDEHYFTQETSCTCTRTRCLKLYCVCFQKRRLCNTQLCKCLSCQNTAIESGPDGARTMAIRAIMAKRPGAFEVREKKPGTGCACKKNR